MRIIVDMDGTLNRFYDFPNWLECFSLSRGRAYVGHEATGRGNS